VKSTAVAQQSLKINRFGAESRDIQRDTALESAYNPGKHRGISGIV